MQTDSETNQEIEEIARLVRECDDFTDVEHTAGMTSLDCIARETADSARFRVEHVDGSWYVGMFTPDRWLSESIEAELMHCGDTIEELIEEELIELEIDPEEVRVQHFRDDSMNYVFRTPVTAGSNASAITTWLMACLAAFRPLGDMTEESED